ncbi:MAG: Rpn family recombination-promoting nuclease/putative transposase [Waterburya sp.]
MAKINHDQLFKELLTTFFVEFLELFFPSILEYLDTDSIQFVDKELFTDVVGGEKKIMDIVALTKFQEQDYSFLIHVENQASNAPEFNRRMFRYFCSLFLKYDRPIYPIVVFSYGSPQRLDKSSFAIDFPHKQVLNFDYEIVQLNRLNWRDFLQQKNPVAAALMSKMKIDPIDRPTVKAQCLRLLVTLKLDSAKMQLISGFVDSYLRLNANEEALFQSELGTMETMEQEQIMQITTSWKEEGRVEEKLAITLRLLNRKLGNIPEAISDHIKSLKPIQLDSLTEDLLDFQSLDDLQNWLSNS